MRAPLLRSIETLPGLLLCGSVAAVAYAGEALEARLFGRAWLEALVLAILIGTAVRSLVAPPACCRAGIAVSGKLLLEVAVVLLGFSISAAAVVAAGPALIGGIMGVVALAIALSYAIGRGFGLSHKMAVLIACGNSICGNSAIAATAPVIEADSDDVAASIAFTAVLGVVVVLVLPLAVRVLSLSPLQYGIFAGLTVYAVPQVLAATAPVGALSVQIGTLVKLVRVLMLGPVVTALLVLGRRRTASGPRLAIGRLVPPFILGFIGAAALRSTGLVPAAVLGGASMGAGFLTTVAMAALGLGVDARAVGRAGMRVTGTVVLSLLGLAAVSLGLIAWLGPQAG